MQTLQQPTDSNVTDSGTLKSRLLMYVAWILASSAAFAGPLRSVVRFAAENDDASHIVVIPIISAVLLYLQRRPIFARLSRDFTVSVGLGALAIGVAAITAARHGAWDVNTSLAGYTLAVVLLWIAGFGFFFGGRAFRAARFPLFFLVLAVPLPTFLLAHVVHALQTGSAAIVSAIFEVTGTPFLRDGFVFQLGRFAIEIAEECSGIRSSMAILILALLAAHFYLRTFWKQVVFIACSLLIMIVKNGVRIATLTFLSLHVNPAFLFGRLHRDGGVVFFLLGMVLLLPILLVLQRGEISPQPLQPDLIASNRAGKLNEAAEKPALES
jgi:exosortase